MEIDNNLENEIKKISDRDRFIQLLEPQILEFVDEVVFNLDESEYWNDVIADIVLSRKNGEYQSELLKELFSEGPLEDKLYPEERNIIANYIYTNPSYIRLIADYLSEDDIIYLLSKIPAEEIKEIIIAHIPNISSNNLVKIINELENTSAKLFLLSFLKDKFEYKDIMQTFINFEYDDDKLEFYSIFSDKLQNSDVIKIVSTIEFDDRKEWLYQMWIENISDVLQSEGDIANFIEYIGGYNRKRVIENFIDLKSKKLVEKAISENTEYANNDINSLLSQNVSIEIDVFKKILENIPQEDIINVIMYFNRSFSFEQLLDLTKRFIENDAQRKSLITELLQYHISETTDKNLKEITSWYANISKESQQKEINEFIKKVAPGLNFFENLQYIIDEDELDVLSNMYDKNNIILDTINYKFINRGMREKIPKEVLEFLSKYPIQNDIIELIENNPQKLKVFSTYINTLHNKYSYYEDLTDVILKAMSQSQKKQDISEIASSEEMFESMYNTIYESEIFSNSNNSIEYAFFKKIRIPLDYARKLISIYGNDIETLMQSNNNPILAYLNDMKRIIANIDEGNMDIINLINTANINQLTYEQLVCFEKELKIAYNKDYLENLSEIPQTHENVKNARLAKILEDCDIRSIGLNYKIITTLIGAFSNEVFSDTNPVENWNRVSNTQNHCINASFSTNQNNSVVRKFRPGERKTTFGFNLNKQSSEKNNEEIIYQIAPYDSYSNAQYSTVKLQRSPLYSVSANMPSMARYLYTDFVLERGIQPDYLVVYDLNNPLNDTEEFIAFMEQQKSIANAFGIPIVNIERTDIAKNEYDCIVKAVEKFQILPSPELATEIIERFCNNRNGYVSPSGNISEDIIGNELLNKYFSYENFRQITNSIYDCLKSLKGQGADELSEQISKAIILAINNEIKKSNVIKDTYDKYNLFFDSKEILNKFIQMIFKDSAKTENYQGSSNSDFVQSVD